MNVRRIVWFGVSTLAIASWFASASTSGVRPPAVPFPPPKPSPVDFSMVALQSEVGRLHERLAPTAAPTRSRDLFRFQSRIPERRAPLARPAAPVDVVAEAPAPPAPALALIGVAEDATADGVIRTAIVSGLGDVFLVKAGETIRDRYRIGAVSADAVQVVDTVTGSDSTLALR
ncbi:MAG: hypothetical protein AB7H96_04445 [Vicinamibacterales bacterium]